MTLSRARIAGSFDLSPRKPLTIANQPLHLTSDHDFTMCRESRDPGAQGLQSLLLSQNEQSSVRHMAEVQKITKMELNYISVASWEGRGPFKAIQ